MIELILRITFSLLIVFGLMWGLAKLAKRPLGRRGTGVLDVLSRQQLTRGSSVAVVRVADRALVVGITDQQVSLLGETDLAAVEAQLAPAPVDALHGQRRDAIPVAGPVAGPLDGSALSPKTWRSLADFLRERTARR